jgi:hypothetical protein
VGAFVVVVLVYAGERLSLLADLFSAHPTANASGKSRKMDDNFVALIAWRAL